MRELPPGAVVGTASLRRQALVKRLRPDLEVVPFRGNVETRLRKLDAGEVDATLLALAGLKRLGLADAATEVLAAGGILPAVGQGIIAIEARADDAATRTLLAAINHADSMTALVAERAFLAVLDGSCRTPIAGHATIAAAALRFRGLIAQAGRQRSVRDRARWAPPAMPPRSAPTPVKSCKRARRRRFLRPGVSACASSSPDPSPMASARRRRCARAGYEVLVAPLLRIEPVDAELRSGPWHARGC